MALAQDGFIARHEQRRAEAQQAFAEAYPLERKAAEQVTLGYEQEPTRSILYRSAAWLALDAGLLADAEHMAEEGLRGVRHPEIRRELEAVCFEVKRRRNGYDS